MKFDSHKNGKLTLNCVLSEENKRLKWNVFYVSAGHSYTICKIQFQGMVDIISRHVEYNKLHLQTTNLDNYNTVEWYVTRVTVSGKYTEIRLSSQLFNSKSTTIEVIIYYNLKFRICHHRSTLFWALWLRLQFRLVIVSISEVVGLKIVVPQES